MLLSLLLVSLALNAFQSRETDYYYNYSVDEQRQRMKVQAQLAAWEMQREAENRTRQPARIEYAD